MKKLSILLLMVLCLACAKKKADPQPAIAQTVSLSTMYSGIMTRVQLEGNGTTVNGYDLNITKDSLGYIFYFAVLDDWMSDGINHCSHRVTISGNSITMTPHIIDPAVVNCMMTLQWGYGTINTDGSIAMDWQYSTTCQNHFHWTGTFKK